MATLDERIASLTAELESLKAQKSKEGEAKSENKLPVAGIKQKMKPDTSALDTKGEREATDKMLEPNDFLSNLEQGVEQGYPDPENKGMSDEEAQAQIAEENKGKTDKQLDAQQLEERLGQDDLLLAKEDMEGPPYPDPDNKGLSDKEVQALLTEGDNYDFAKGVENALGKTDESPIPIDSYKPQAETKPAPRSDAGEPIQKATEATEVAEDAPPAINEDRAAQLFETTHGGSFDPKSSMDTKKMAVIKAQMEKQPELSKMDEDDFDKQRNKFALGIYRL